MQQELVPHLVAAARLWSQPRQIQPRRFCPIQRVEDELEHPLLRTTKNSHRTGRQFNGRFGWPVAIRTVVVWVHTP